ncbi:MAG: DNA gyrase subunit A [Euryarchaeota archaeon]|nr:DNA gyrase subunit A [Euryarchaeota archaeon]
MTSEDENVNIESGDTTETGNVLNRSLNDEMKTSYINYAMSVIIGRALPDARDGLKPVHRRVLYGMHEGGHTSEKKFSKSARSVGEVMGKYHPHGDQSIYDTMVRMAQEFSLRYPLIDGQGNFGSVDGDPPAAMRYTESRLDRISKHMLEDIEKKTVDFEPNFDDSEMEPAVLPARLPNLLLNGSDGIAVGMATRIPPHNLTEVAGAIQLHVSRILEEGEENKGLPNVSIKEYMQHVQGPDFPTGATIHGVDGIFDMYSTGKGRFHVRSKCDVYDDSNGKKIVIHEIPYQVKKADMLIHIAELVTKGTVVGIRDIRDESSKEGIRVVIEVKNNADPHAVLNQLFKSSRLQESYSANMMGILDGRPVLLTLPVMIHTHVEHRESVIERRTAFDLAKAEARIHLIEGLLIVAENSREITDMVRESEDYEEVHSKLNARFDMSEIQSRAVYDMPLGRLTKQSVGKLNVEKGDLQIAIQEYRDILGSRSRKLRVLLEELTEMVKKHGDNRRSDIDPMPLSMDREDLIEERAIVITLTNDNYIRHLPAESFRMQNRGGKGMKGVQTKNEDFPTTLMTCFSKDRLLIFTNRPATKKDQNGNEKPYIEGRVYGLRAWETPQGSRTSRGGHIRNIIGLKDDETVVSIVPLSKGLIENPADNYLAFATRKGKIKKSLLSHYIKINRNGKKAIDLAEDDELISVRSGADEDNVVLVSNNGLATRFSLSAVRAQGRVSSGVRGLKLKGDSTLVGMIITNDENTSVLTLSEQGMGKRTRIGTGDSIPLMKEGDPVLDSEGKQKMETDGYRLAKNRGGSGVKTMNLNDGDSIARVHQIPDLEDQLFLLSRKGTVIRISASQTKETSGRASKGTRVMELRNKDKNGYTDELIYSARMPSDLVEQMITENTRTGSSEEE